MPCARDRVSGADCILVQQPGGICFSAPGGGYRRRRGQLGPGPGAGGFQQSAGASARFQAYLAALPNLEQLVEADDLLRQYRFYFRQAREDSRYLLGSQGRHYGPDAAVGSMPGEICRPISPVQWRWITRTASPTSPPSGIWPMTRTRLCGRPPMRPSWPATGRSRTPWPLPELH